MQPRPARKSTNLEMRLLKAWRRLPPGHQDSVVAFAEFLAARDEAEVAAPGPPAQPVLIPRPERESVIGAIKRLTASYPMVDRAAMLNQTSSLVTQHLVQGRPAAAVIDDLEALFRDHYAALCGDGGDG